MVQRDPKIVFFDLETIPDLPEVMKVYPRLSDYPGRTLKASITTVICFGYKILGEKTKIIHAWDFKKTWDKSINDDKEIMKASRDILADVDAVVTFNGRKFDWPFYQTRLLRHKLPPLPNIPHIDICYTVRKKLLLFSNKLDDVSKFLIDDKKVENGGWDLWVDVFYRKAEALKTMSKYCVHDVDLTAKIFKIVRPFMNNLPNYNLHTIPGTEPICPNCQSTRIERRGYVTTKTNTYHRYVCKDCHSWSRTNAEDKGIRAI